MPEIIDEIIKTTNSSYLEILPENARIIKESEQFVKEHGRKYELIPCDELDYRMYITSEALEYRPKNFYRIRALKTFYDVKKGDIGGIIDKTSLLSHAGNCWIYDNAVVGCESYITDDAVIKDTSKVYSSFIKNNSKILNESSVTNSKILDSSIIKNYASIIDSNISGKSEICDFSSIIDSVCENSHIEKHVGLLECVITTSSKLSGVIDLNNCFVLENASVTGWFNAVRCIFTNNAKINLDVDINENTSHIIGLNAEIHNDEDFLTIHGFSKNKLPITFFNCSDNKIRCILNDDFGGDFSETREYVLKNDIEDYDGEFDDIAKYVEKKLKHEEK